MPDPLADIIAMLRPGASHAKLVNASGAWRVRRTDVGRVYYCATLAGSARLTVDGDHVDLAEGDFVLIPAAHDFTMASRDAPGDVASVPVDMPDGTVRLGPPAPPGTPPDTQQLVGYCTFGSPDASLLVPLLPGIAVVRGERRLGVIAQLLRDEARADRPARAVVLGHLLQVLLIEALRSTGAAPAAPGLLRGLADARVGRALRAVHADPAAAWTVPMLAAEAGMSRSAFFEHFATAVGVPPTAYVLNWRMALAKDLLNRGGAGVAEVAARVGYASASAFSTAFAREVGLPPARYAKAPAQAVA